MPYKEKIENNQQRIETKIGPEIKTNQEKMDRQKEMKVQVNSLAS
jgi:hypothetical protein